MTHKQPFPITLFPVTAHTDFVGAGSTFFALPGASHHGAEFISSALKKGAKTVVIEQNLALSDELLQEITEAQATLINTNTPLELLATLSAQAAGNPAEKLHIIGITGTKGKSTTTFLVEHILRSAGYKTAVISTVHNKIIDTIYPNLLTTPPADYLHQFLALCVKAGVTHVVMEVSAQALTLKRVHGIQFSGVILTNLVPDHSEFYSTHEAYFDAKLSLLDHVSKKTPIIFNPSTFPAEYLAQKAAEQYLLLPISLVENSPFIYAKPVHKDQKWICDYHVYYQKTKGIRLRYQMQCPQLIGQYNAENMLSAVGLSIALGINPEIASQSLMTFQPVPGRWQELQLPNGARAIIDYAHNPASFYTVLSTMKVLTDNLIVVFGAGGNRGNKESRAELGEIAHMFANSIVLTTDNPRTENPLDIARDVAVGIQKQTTWANYKDYQEKKSQSEPYCIELDRKKAIQKAYELSTPNSIIAILGKGPDEYQIIGTTKTYFSDYECVKELQKQI